MYILGIKAFGHDTSACLIKDRKIIAASSQERFDRIKHSSAFPFDAINFCLDTASIKINNISEIGVSYNYTEAILRLYFLRALLYFPLSLFNLKDFNKILTTRSKILKILQINLKFKGKISFLDHHDCHAASAYYCSSFSKSAIITNDGRGEWATARIYIAENGKFQKYDQINYPNSIGLVYENITNYLGFIRNCDEGKIMGLAPYGKPIYYKKFSKIINIVNKWKYKLDLSYFNHHLKEQSMLPDKFIKEFGKPRSKNQKLTTRHKDIASSLQKITDDVCLLAADKAKDIRKDKYLCIAGGVGLNAVSNGAIYNKKLFKSIFIQPASGDDGTSLGAATLIASRYFKNYKINDFSPYLGKNVEKDKLITIINKNKGRINVSKPINIFKSASVDLSRRKIVAWYQGRAEFGPRALGNRSILADPRDPKMKDYLNKKVKFREEFRPFAPAVLYKYSRSFFKLYSQIPYMIITVAVEKKNVNKIPAVVHILLNTSFNIKGEPIVNSVEQALNCFLKTGIDIMYINEFRFEK